MNNLLKYIDLGFAVVMAVMLYIIFSLGRWIEDSPLSAIVFIGFYYLIYVVNRKISVPMMFKSGHQRVLGLLIFVAAVLAMMALTHYSPGWPFYELASFYHDSSKVEMSQQRAWLFFVTVQTFSIAVGVLNEYWQLRLREQILKQQRDKIELALFQAQLNPHILYNTLNSVYGLVVTKNEHAEESFIQAIELSRYMSSMTHREYVSVDDEAQYISNYIDLQRLRLSAHSHITFTYDSNNPEAQVAPMLLITFVGNALKYGTSVTQATDINVDLVVNDQGLFLNVSNPIIAGSARQSSGTGILNCRNRLQLIYPNRHTLDIVERDGRFVVNLHIKI